MISVITAIHNQLAVNKLFFENLKKYTHHPFELIIIDNNSNDGSREFFKSNGALVIENDGNYSYPYCQNQGIKKAQYDVFAFLNNDIIVAPNWDKKMLEAMQQNQLEVATVCGVERVENKKQTKSFRLRWKFIKTLVGLFGKNYSSLKIMHQLMYGNWEKFSDIRYNTFGNTIIEGFVGNSVIIKKSALEKIGMWDERIQAADFDLYVRTKKRHIEHNDIKPVHIVLGVFHHHFIRLTAYSKPPEFKDKKNLISFEEKWQNTIDIKSYLKDFVED